MEKGLDRGFDSHEVFDTQDVPPNVGLFNGSDLLISSNCVIDSKPKLYDSLASGKEVLMGCPRLDNPDDYKEKLKAILRTRNVSSITVATMNTPYCSGSLYQSVQQAVSEMGIHLPIKRVVMNNEGKIEKLEMHEA